MWQALVALGILVATLAYAWARLPPLSTGWSWKPCVAEFDYSTEGGQVQTIRVVGTAPDAHPRIDFAPGKKLKIHRVRYGLFPTCYRMGARLLQFENFGDLPRPDTFPRIRLRATVRKYWGNKPREEWYDEESSRVSDWLNVETQVREIDWFPEWDLESDWDMLRFQVEVEGQGFDESAETPIVLHPSNGGTQWDIRHNIFNTLRIEVGIWQLLLCGLIAFMLLSLVLNWRQWVRGSSS